MGLLMIAVDPARWRKESRSGARASPGAQYRNRKKSGWDNQISSSFLVVFCQPQKDRWRFGDSRKKRKGAKGAWAEKRRSAVKKMAACSTGCGFD